MRMLPLIQYKNDAKWLPIFRRLTRSCSVVSFAFACAAKRTLARNRSDPLQSRTFPRYIGNYDDVIFIFQQVMQIFDNYNLH